MFVHQKTEVIFGIELIKALKVYQEYERIGYHEKSYFYYFGLSCLGFLLVFSALRFSIGL